MATVIRTGGQTIRISNGASSARRAVEAVDPISAAMEAGEAFARSEIACEAFGALVNRAAQMSMEGKASMWKRVKAAGTRTWEAIKEFFRKMIAYVTSFISGNVIMLKAKRLKKRIEDDEDASGNFDKNKSDDKLTFNSKYGTRKAFETDVIQLMANYKKVCGTTVTVTIDNKGITSNSDYGYGSNTAYSKSKDLKKAGKTLSKSDDITKYMNNGWDDNMGDRSHKMGDYFSDLNELKSVITNYTRGAVKSMVFLKATVIPTMNKIYKLAEKYAKEAADNSKVAAFKAAQRATKVTVNTIIKQAQIELKIAARMIAEPTND